MRTAGKGPLLGTSARARGPFLSPPRGGPAPGLTSSGQVHANSLYVNTSGGQIRTDLGNGAAILFANTNRGSEMWVGTAPTFETGPRIGFYGDSNGFRPGQVWFTIGGDANPAEPQITVERRTPGAYSFRATLCDRDGNGRWVGRLSAAGFDVASSRETKEKITPFVDDALALINRIGVVSFAYRADQATTIRLPSPSTVEISRRYPSTHVPGSIAYNVSAINATVGLQYRQDALERIAERKLTVSDTTRQFAYDDVEY